MKTALFITISLVIGSDVYAGAVNVAKKAASKQMAAASKVAIEGPITKPVQPSKFLEALDKRETSLRALLEPDGKLADGLSTTVLDLPVNGSIMKVDIIPKKIKHELVRPDWNVLIVKSTDQEVLNQFRNALLRGTRTDDFKTGTVLPGPDEIKVTYATAADGIFVNRTLKEAYNTFLKNSGAIRPVITRRSEAIAEAVR